MYLSPPPKKKLHHYIQTISSSCDVAHSILYMCFIEAFSSPRFLTNNKYLKEIKCTHSQLNDITLLLHYIRSPLFNAVVLNVFFTQRLFARRSRLDFQYLSTPNSFLKTPVIFYSVYTACRYTRYLM